MNNYFGNISSEHCCNHAHGKVKISITCFTKNPARKNNLEIPSGFSLFLLIQVFFLKNLISNPDYVLGTDIDLVV